MNLNQKSESDSSLRLLAAQVLQQYNMNPDELSVIQSGSVKAVWKFRYKGREYCLKRLKQTLDKVLFSVHAQIYIRNAGGNVPEVILTQSGEPVVKLNNELFAVYEWLDGKDLAFGNPKQLSLALGGLARFHTASKGYTAIEGARVSSKLGKWPNQYESMKSRMLAWKETAGGHSAPQHKSYLACLDSVTELANQAILRLDKSKYRELASEHSSVPVLCHQDYGKGNALLTDKGVVVIDLDNVSFDLPSRDLRKIIGKIAQDNNRWDRKTIEDILMWYSNVNAVSEDEKTVLYIDLLFPHWFFGLVKNQYEKLKDIKASDIERIARLEQSKVPVLRELLER
jgi:spore coat protein I